MPTGLLRLQEFAPMRGTIESLKRLREQQGNRLLFGEKNFSRSERKSANRDIYTYRYIWNWSGAFDVKSWYLIRFALSGIIYICKAKRYDHTASQCDVTHMYIQINVIINTFYNAHTFSFIQIVNLPKKNYNEIIGWKRSEKRNALYMEAWMEQCY
jgi:hypothetical protein